MVNNSGTIISSASSLSLGNYPGDTVTNSGTIEMNGAGNIFVASTSSQVTNFSGNTLTGGTWIAQGGGTIYFPNSANTIATNAAGTTIVLGGIGSNIRSGPSSDTLDQTLVTNDGTLEVLGGRNFTATNAVANNGTIQLGGGTFSAPSLTNGSGSTLSGYGTFTPASGGVTIATGMAVSPGSASANSYVGALAFNGSLTLGPGGSTTFDVENASGTPGVGYDTITVGGALTISATPGTPFALNLESINPGTGLPGAAAFSMTQSYQWTLAAATSVSGFSASDFAINPASFANGLGGGSFSLSSSATDIYLNFTPVPEPSTWALMAGGVAAAVLLSGKRRAAGLAVRKRSAVI